MKKIYLIDGFGGSPKDSWMTSLEGALSQEFEIKKLEFSNPNIADPIIWMNDLLSQLEDVGDSYFICHSLGCITLLRYLYKYSEMPLGIVFVSPFNQKIPDFPNFDGFVLTANLSDLKINETNSIVISAQNDSVIPWNASQSVASELGIPFILLPNGNHFRAEDGVTTFPFISNYCLNNWSS